MVVLIFSCNWVLTESLTKVELNIDLLKLNEIMKADHLGAFNSGKPEFRTGDDVIGEQVKYQIEKF